MFETIKKVIADQLNVDESSVKPESSLLDDLKADSLDLAALILDLEEQYNIEIPDEDMAKLKTVGDIADYIQSKSQ